MDHSGLFHHLQERRGFQTYIQLDLIVYVVLVRLHLMFFAMFEPGNLTRYNGARRSAVREEILC